MNKFPDTDGATLCLTLVNDLRQVSLLSGFVDRIRKENDLAPALAARIHLVRSIMDSISYSRLDGKNVLTMIICL